MRTRTVNPVMAEDTRHVETGIDLPASLGFLVGAVAKRTSARLAAALAVHGLTPAQWSVLACLWREDGLTQTELSARSGIDPATLTEMLKRMATAGRVTRRRDAHNQRFQRVYLADADLSMRDEIADSAAAINAAATGGFTDDERNQLAALLTRALANLAEAPTTDAGSTVDRPTDPPSEGPTR